MVLYFFPKAFTKGCTLEAHAFSEAVPEFRKAGARVIGLSADNIATLKKFSVEECRSAFPVGRASPELIREYDVSWKEQEGARRPAPPMSLAGTAASSWSTTTSTGRSTSPRRWRR